MAVQLDSRCAYSFSGQQHDLWVVKEIFVDRHVRHPDLLSCSSADQWANLSASVSGTSFPAPWLRSFIHGVAVAHPD